MSDMNDKNRIRRKTVSSRDSEKSRTRSDEKTRLKIKKQVSSGSNLSNPKKVNSKNRYSSFARDKKSELAYGSRGQRRSSKEDNVVDFGSYRSRDRSTRSNEDRYTYREKNLDRGYDLEKYENYLEDYKDRSGLFRIIKKLVIFVLVVTIILGSAGFLYVRSITSDMPVLTKKMVKESYINKEPVELDKIPKDLQKAVIAVEDDTFYKHKGINYKSMLRSFINNLTNDKKQGGSTIDMQVSKNLLTSNERTIKRKIQDMHNARQLNKIMTKDEILEAYLNNIYLGKSAYGVNAGAQLYFGKNVWKLSFGESTMLAGITNNPGLYQNYEEAKKRQAVVCYRMYKLGLIKENVYKAQLYRDTPFKSEIDR